MLFVNVKSFFPYPNKYKRIYIEEIKIKTLELFFTLDNVVDNRITQIQECIIKCMTKCCIGIKAPFSFFMYLYIEILTSINLKTQSINALKYMIQFKGSQ